MRRRAGREANVDMPQKLAALLDAFYARLCQADDRPGAWETPV